MQRPVATLDNKGLGFRVTARCTYLHCPVSRAGLCKPRALAPPGRRAESRLLVQGVYVEFKVLGFGLSGLGGGGGP